MENQHRIIKGYRELSEAEIALMNEIKAHAERTEGLMNMVEAHLRGQFKAVEPTYGEPVKDADGVESPFVDAPCIDTPEQTAAKKAEGDRLKHTQPYRWHAIARTDLQTGFMALTRAVAQPGTF